jgi:hypothetical protein
LASGTGTGATTSATVATGMTDSGVGAISLAATAGATVAAACATGGPATSGSVTTGAAGGVSAAIVGGVSAATGTASGWGAVDSAGANPRWVPDVTRLGGGGATRGGDCGVAGGDCGVAGGVSTPAAKAGTARRAGGGVGTRVGRRGTPAAGVTGCGGGPASGWAATAGGVTRRNVFDCGRGTPSAGVGARSGAGRSLTGFAVAAAALVLAAAGVGASAPSDATRQLGSGCVRSCAADVGAPWRAAAPGPSSSFQPPLELLGSEAAAAKAARTAGPSANALRFLRAGATDGGFDGCWLCARLTVCLLAITGAGALRRRQVIA